MGLITDLILRMTKSNRMNFNDFDKNYLNNCKIFAKHKNDILKENIKTF